MLSKKYKQSLRPNGLKRKFFRNIPILLLFVVLIFLLVFGLFFLSNFIISKQNIFLSPLALVKNSKDTNVEDLLNKSNMQFVKVEQGPQNTDVIVHLKDQGIVYLDLKKNPASQISSLQVILSRLTIEGKKFKKLDLRFDKPIIEF